VRTSALAEDGVSDSFAGQYYTGLDVAPVDIAEHLRTCVASLFSPGVAAYAKSKGLTHIEVGGSIVVQQMFRGARAGVMFTEDGRGNVTLAFADGSANATVEGHDATHVTVPKLGVQPRSTPVPR